jgi:poly(A) polymerase Pap1
MASASAVPKLGVTDPISVAPPSALDLALSEELERELRAAGLYEANEEAVAREEVRVRVR